MFNFFCNYSRLCFGYKSPKNPKGLTKPINMYLNNIYKNLKEKNITITPDTCFISDLESKKAYPVNVT